MKRFVAALVMFIAFGAALPVSAGYGNGYENDDMFATAVVEGTRDYTIKFFDGMRKALAKHTDEKQFAQFGAALAEAKNENAALVGKIITLKSRKEFLKQSDPAFAHYRETLAKTTASMFLLMNRVSDHNSPPPW